MFLVILSCLLCSPTSSREMFWGSLRPTVLSFLDPEAAVTGWRAAGIGDPPLRVLHSE